MKVSASSPQSRFAAAASPPVGNAVENAILYPSEVISDQYASQNVLTVDGRTLTGLVVPSGVGQFVVQQSDGTKVTLSEDEIDEMSPSRVSSMPTGLLDELTLQEITDLLHYMGVTSRQRIAELETNSESK